MPDSDLVSQFSNVPPMMALWPFLLAAGVYVLLRWVIREPRGGASAATASQHSFWVGTMGWLASSLQPAGNAGILPAGSAAPAMTPGSIVTALAWPVLGCLAVHAIGQLSYPGPRLPRRLATLEVRRVRDFLPRPLAWTVLAVIAGAALQIFWTSTLPGFAPVPYGSSPDSVHGHTAHGGDGRVPGIALASYLGSALLVLVAGTWLVLQLITRRRQLEPLNARENDLLRTIAMNRLLRTVATIAAGLAAIAGNHAARPEPSAGSGAWTNAAGAAGLAVLLVMWWWAPPKLPGARDVARNRGRPERAAATHPATRLSVSLGAALGLAGLVPAVVALIIPGVVTGQPALVVAVSAASVLVAAAAGELLMHRNYGARGAPRTWPRQPVSPLLLSTGIAALAVLVVVIVLTGVAEAALGVPPSWPGTVWAGAAVAVLSALPLTAARVRHGIPAAVPGLDAALRAITVHRVVRGLAACFTVQAGVLLLSAAPAVRRALNLNPAAWAGFWDMASAVGALLAAAGVVIAAIPVRGFARTAPPVSRPVGQPAR
ncbi:hypothetical protein ACFVYC_00400 [Pseudarthrobacter sp. NPDC058329]|uniref:hypothetical protein n=1 Tax=Pseudarthrobacter sp. NPDC058329 TaxID=3346448 RepID=UPI0036DBECAC